MNRLYTTVVCAGDPGGANALLPVLRQLRARGDQIIALAAREARRIWATAGIPLATTEEDLDPVQMRTWLVRTRANRVLTATSVNGINVEQRLWRAAKDCAIPTLAVIDFWANYRQRFTLPGGGCLFPDRIAVMDAQTRTEAIADGIDAASLVVTGQPALDELDSFRHRPCRDSVRNAFNLSFESILVLFASQPLPGKAPNLQEGEDWPDSIQRTLLPAVREALAMLARTLKRPITLVVRPHPRENPAERTRTTQGVVEIVSAHGDRREIAMAADVVVGMTSILLVEACLLERPVVSIQPGLRGYDILPTNRCGASTAVYSLDGVLPALEQILCNPDRPGKQASMMWVPDATERVIATLDDLTAQPACENRVRKGA